MKKLNDLVQLNDLVHCTAEIVFVPGSRNSIAFNTYAFDTLKINNEVVNAKELYAWLKKQYEPIAYDERHYVCASTLY